jgi:hypothetical protein
MPTTKQNASWKQEPLAAPARRGFDWIYHSLWMASDGSKAACQVNVPSTVLFHAGEPKRWIETDDNGRAVRRLFPSPPKRTGGGKAVVRELRLRATWDGLLRFSEKMRRMGVGSPDKPRPVVIAWYRDGGKELLDVETWSRLMGHRNWTSQLIALQGYVHASSTSEGKYTAGTLMQDSSIASSNPALDTLTKSLAQYCEGAYQRAAEATEQKRNVRGEPSVSIPRIRVVRMKSSYIVDPSGKLWLSHCEDVITQDMAAPAPDPVAQVALSAELAATAESELRTLLRQAANRGVSVQTSFEHFDAKKKGEVSTTEFVQGMRKLGLALPPAAAEMFLSRMALNKSGRIGIEEFSAFVFEAFALAYPDRAGTADADILMQSSPVSRHATTRKEELDMRSLSNDLANGIASPLKTSSSLGGIRSLARAESAETDFRANLEQGSAIPISNNVSTGSLQRAKKVPRHRGGQKDGELLPSWARDSTREVLETLQQAERDIASGKRRSVFGNMLDPMGPVEAGDDAVLDAEGGEIAEEKDGESKAIEAIEEKEEVKEPEDSASEAGSLGIGQLEIPQQQDDDLPEDVEVFEIDEETTMLYKIITLPSVSGFDGIAKGKYSEAVAAAAAGLLRNIAVIPGQDHLSLILVPDFMETMESMFDRVKFLFVRYPHLRILMIQFPGQPGTRYRRSDKLNNKYLANCFFLFMRNLRTQRMWHWKPRPGVGMGEDEVMEDAVRRPMLLVGNGNGANVVAYYVIFHMRQDPQTPLASTLRAAMFVNAFAYLDKNLNRSLKRFIRLCSRAAHAERMQNLCQMFFSQRYLNDVSRSTALERFYSTRHVPVSMAQEGHDIDTAILSLLRGALDHVDLRPYLERMTLPVLLIQSSENVFVLPTHAETFLEAVGGADRAAESIEKCLATRKDRMAMHVSYLRSGHVVYQERDQAMHMIMERLTNSIEKGKESTVEEDERRRRDAEEEAREAGLQESDSDVSSIISTSSEDEDAEALKKQNKEEAAQKAAERKARKAERDRIKKEKLLERKKKGGKAEKKVKKPKPFGGMELSKKVRRGLKKGGIEWVSLQLEKRQLSTEGENIDLVKRLEASYAAEKKEEHDKIQKMKEEARLKKEAEEAEEQAKAKIAAREKRKDDMKRKAEIRELREEHAEEEAEQRLLDERRCMTNEDYAAAFQEKKYRLDKNLVEAGEKAKGFLTELREGREKEIKQDKMIATSKKRAEKREQRNRRLEELKNRYKSQELHLEGDTYGYGLDAGVTQLEELVAGCSRLRADMHEIRSRKSNTMIRHDAAVRKRNQFEDKCRAIDKKVRDCRRAIRDTVRAIDDANKRGRRLPNGRRITAKEFKRQQEQRELERQALNDHRLELEQEEQDWKGQLNVAKEEMHAIAGSVQRMTIVQRTKEKELNAMIEKLEGLNAVVSKEKKALRREEIKNARKFATLKKDIMEREERLLKCTGELERCEICPTKFIDSNTWNSFRQRIKVEDLKKFLIREIGLLEEAVAEANNQLKIVEAEQSTHGAKDDNLIKALDVVKEQLKYMIECREDAHVPVAELMRRQKQENDKAASAAKDDELKKAEEERAMALGATSLADKIRIKPADVRLPYEKEFVAYDMLLHPEHYMNVNEVDEETYKFDPGYHTSLSKEDLQRIVVLPEPLNLAMSFLKNEAELNAHQCLQKILFERGEERLKSRDADVAVQEEEMKEMKEMQDRLHQIKLRNERASLRAKPKDTLTEEEAEWLRWDFVLHPHLFFGIKTLGFEPPNVDKKANAKKAEYIGKGKFQKKIAPIKSLEVEHLVFLRSASDEEVGKEVRLPFQLKKYKTMRGTESQLFHVRNLLLRYGWDEYDAPELTDRKAARKKAKEEKRLKALKNVPETDEPGDNNKEGSAKTNKPKLKSKGTMKLKLAGLDLIEFQKSTSARDVILREVAKAMGVDVSSISIKNMEAGSVILELEVTSEQENDKELSSRLDGFEKLTEEGDFEIAVQNAMDKVLDIDSAALEVAEIKKLTVTSLEEKAPIDAKTAARMKRKAERDARRESRQKKKDEKERKKKEKAEKEAAARKKAEAEEKESQNNQLRPELAPVHTWFQMIRTDTTYEDPRFQFGDPVPANHRGGIHVDIISANNLKAMDFSLGGGSSDPYVKVTVGAKGPKRDRQTYKTATKKKTLRPKWTDEKTGEKEHFDFFREPQMETVDKSEVLIEVYDYDVGSGNDFMGEIKLNINELPFDRQGNLRPVNTEKFEKDSEGIRTIKLASKNKKAGTAQGTLSFRCWRTPSSDERADTMKYISAQKARRAERARTIRLKAMQQKIERQRLIAEAEEKNKKREEALKKKRAREKELAEKRKAKELARKEAELKAFEEAERKQREALALMPMQVVNNVSEIPEAVRRGPVLMRKRPDEKPVVTILDESEKSLAMRQSCWHEFVVPENVKSIELRSIIVFKGVFTMRGYILGRISAALYRVPEDGSPPVSVGYSPAAQCKLNTPETLGQITIVHAPSPKCLPVTSGRYRVVIGAASKTEYSITCSVRTAYTSTEACEARLLEAKKKSTRRPHTQQELYDLLMSIRLSERKYKLVEGLIADAEEECEKIQGQIAVLNKSLEFDENKDGLTDEEVKEIDMAVGRKELEFSGAVKRAMTRKQELRDIMDGLVRMAELKRGREDEMQAIDEFLIFQRRYLPKATATAVSIKIAAKYAQEINARFVPDDHLHHKMGQKGKLEVAALGHMLTPAQKLRRRAQHLPHAGFGVLLEEESRWVAYDRVYNPFDWEEYSSGEEEIEEEESEEEDSDVDSDDSEYEKKKEKKKPKKLDPKKRFVADVSRDDIIRIMKANKEDLTVKEEKIRKLINKFHDRSITNTGPDLGQEKRDLLHKGGKYAKKLTHEDKEFLVYDKVLHPTWYPEHVKVDKWAGVDGKVGFGDQGHLMNPGLKHDIDGEVHKVIVGDDKIEAAKRKKEEESVKTATGGKVHLGRSDTGEEHIVILGPTPEQVLRAEIKHEQETHGLREGDEHWYKYERPADLVLTEYDIRLLLRKAKEDPSYVDTLDPRRQRVVYLLDKFKPPPVRLGQSAYDRRGKDGPMINFDAKAAKVDLDIDRRCRTVQEELDLAYMCSTHYMKSDVMHSVPQKFPIDVLRADLERELDRLLVLQVVERERATKLIDASKDYGEDASDSSDDEDNEQARILKRRRKAAAEMRAERKKKGIKVAGKGYKASMAGMSKKEQEAAQKKADLAKELSALGPNGCIACRKKECAWVEPVPYLAIKKRRGELDLERARMRNIDKSVKMIESTVVRSVKNGGIPQMTREDADHELQAELEYSFQLIKLHDIDQELHYAYSVREDYVETEVLHGFKQMQWTKNVITALERERNKIIALQLSHDIVDDILQWMLEGWYFGERESKLPAMGYVPSLKKDGPIRVHEAHLLAQGGFKDRGDEAESRGKPEDKLALIAKEANGKIERQKAIRAGSDQDHLLKQTETNLKFGIFSLTLQYFRAMTLVRRQYETWSGRKAAMALEGKAPPREVTEERGKMEKEQNQLQLRLKRTEEADKKAQLGRERRKKRVDKERAQQRENMLVMVRRRNLEKAGAIKLQSLYRGHLGRLAAMKWAVKKAEIDAMRALQHAASVAIQRVWRGVQGRQIAEEKRIEMAEFIASMRAAEAMEEEEEYWRTHAWERYKRDFRAWWRKKTGQETRITGAQRLAEEADEMAAGEARLAEEEEEAARAWEAAVDSDEDDEWEPEGGTNL